MGKRKIQTEKQLYLALEKCTKKIREKFNTLLSNNNIDITFDQWLILKEVSEDQGVNQKDVASLLSKEVASVSRILKKLVEKNLVTKKSNKANMREYKLYLTPEGYELIEKGNLLSPKLFSELFSTVYEQELNLVTKVITRVNGEGD